MKFLIPTAVSLVAILTLVNLPASWFSLSERRYGATVTEITTSTNLADFPDIHNANINALNDNKIEISTTSLPLLTTLTNLVTVGTITSGTWSGTTIGVSKGGTGSTTLSQYSVLLGSSTNAIGMVSGLGTSGQFLTSNGTGASPTWQSASVDESQAYDWTNAHTWTATTTFPCTAGNKVILNSLEYVCPSSHVTNGVLKNNGSGTLSWSVPNRLIATNLSPATIVTSSASTTIFSATIPGGTLSTSNLVRVTISLENIVIANANNAFIAFNYGGATSTTIISNASGGTTSGGGELEFVIAGAGTTGSQETFTHFIAIEENADTDSDTISQVTSASLAVDSTQDQTLLLIVKQSEATTGAFTPNAVFIEALRQ